jgi:hypothetical protein
MRDDFKLEVLAKKVCLTIEQVRERNIPPNFEAKKTSARYVKFAAKYGDRAHELEALDPKDLAELLEDAILGVMDMEAFNREVEKEKKDLERIEAIREDAIKVLDDALEDIEDEDIEDEEP